VRRILGSGLGLGFLPLAPGTWASAALVLVFIGLWQVWPGLAGGWPCRLVPGLAALILAAAGVALGTLVEDRSREEREKDPRWFVLDELAGQSVALVGVGGPDAVAGAAISFVFFRVFDIIKPWPLKRLEALPGGWGITADDAAAGLLALASRVVVTAVWVWIRG
jgi:phosphatidylglycerophosphatase A